MSKILPVNYNFLKNEQNIPDAIATTDLKNGYVVKLGIDAKGKHTATTIASDTDAKGELYFVWNVITMPELDDPSDFTIKQGEFARIFNFEDCKNQPLYISADLINKEAKVGDKLVADDAVEGKLKVSAAVTGYKVSFVVTEVCASAQGKIYIADVKIAD